MKLKVYKRGPVTDLTPLNEDGQCVGLAMVHCIHGKQWPEGGSGCMECLTEWRESEAHKRLGEGDPSMVPRFDVDWPNVTQTWHCPVCGWDGTTPTNHLRHTGHVAEEFGSAAGRALADEFGLPYDPHPTDSSSWTSDYWNHLARVALEAECRRATGPQMERLSGAPRTQRTTGGCGSSHARPPAPADDTPRDAAGRIWANGGDERWGDVATFLENEPDENEGSG